MAGDPFTTQYVLRSVDKCQNKITTQASLQPLVPPSFTSELLPCVGTLNYTMSIIPYGGEFTYRWVKLPDINTTLSTTTSLTLSGAYQAAYDGTYRCYITLAGCIDRTIERTLSSTNATLGLWANPVCVGDTIKLLSTGGISYNWSGPNGFSSTLQNPIITNATLLNAGNYSVTVTNVDGCQLTGDTNLIVNICNPCSVIITAVPSSCNPTDNVYTLTGDIQLTNPPTSGTLTVQIVGGGSQTFDLSTGIPTSYSIANQNSDGANHTVTLTISGVSCASSTTYNAPVDCLFTCPTPNCASIKSKSIIKN